MQTVKQVLHHAIGRLGYRVYRTDYLPVGIDWMWDIARLSRSRSVDIILDVGANEGQTAVPLSERFPHADVYAFEPARKTFGILKANTSSFPHIHPINSAVGDYHGTAQFENRANSVEGRLVPNCSSGNNQVEMVSITTVDEFVSARNLPHIDILKTDTEGFDINVVVGANELLASHAISYIYTEATIRADDRQRSSLLPIHDHLLSLDYHLYAIYDLYHLKSPTRINYLNALFVSATI